MNTSPGPLRPLRIAVAAVVLSLPLVFAVIVAAGLRFDEVETLWLLLPTILGAAGIVLLPAVGSTARPLPYLATEADARRASAAALRTITVLRLALGETPALFGLAISFVAGSLWPYAIGFCFSFPLLLWFAYPRAGVLDEIRSQLEASGARSGL